MYRIFCESLQNYIAQYKTEESKNEYRYLIVKPLLLLLDMNLYNEHKKNNSIEYKKLCTLVKYMELNVDKYPKFKSFLWTLESRGITGQEFYPMNESELNEQAKLVNMFLNLLYW